MIGAINGVAITGGFEVALACDVLIASTNARFADTHARVGIMPGWGLSQRLPRAIGVYRAKELSLSGNFLDAKTALEWGLVNRVVEPDDLLPAAMKLAADMASIPAETLMTYKRIIDGGLDLDLADGLALERKLSHGAQPRGHAGDGRGAARGNPGARAVAVTDPLQSSLTAKIWRPRYMPVFRST